MSEDNGDDLAGAENVDKLFSDDQTTIEKEFDCDEWTSEIQDFLESENEQKETINANASAPLSEDKRADILNRAKGAQRLENKLRKLLSAPATKRNLTRQETGRLDSRSFSRVMSGDTRAFKRTKSTPAENAAVMVLTDVSGSMENSGEILAAAAFESVLVRAMQKARIPYMLMAFDDNVKIRKKFNETLNSKQAEIRALSSVNMVWGSTGLSPAIYNATRTLNRARFPKPVTARRLVIITDGACDHGPDEVKRAIQYARQNGVSDVISIMIGMDTGLGDVSDASALILWSQYDDLSKIGLDLLVK